MREIRLVVLKTFQVGVDASDKEIFTTLRKPTRLEHKDGSYQVNEIRSSKFITACFEVYALYPQCNCKQHCGRITFFKCVRKTFDPFVNLG